MNIQHATRRFARLLPGLFLLLIILATGCGRKKAGGLDSALVPGADVVARINITALRSSALVQTSKKDATPSSVWQPFWNATGLTPDDVTAACISLDLDQIDMTHMPSDAQLNTLQAMMAFQLSKPITLDQLKAGVAAMDITGRATPTNVTIEGESALRSSEGGVVCIQGDGRYVFVAPNERCLGDGLRRFKKGKTEALSNGMTEALKALPVDSQIHAVLVLTEALQAKLKESFNEQKQHASDNLSAGMVLGMLSPMMDVKILGLSATCSSNLVLSLGCTFATVEAATQMKGTADMALTMLAMASKQKGSHQPSSLARSLKVSQTNTVLNVGLTLTPADLRSITSLRNTPGVKP